MDSNGFSITRQKPPSCDSDSFLGRFEKSKTVKLSQILLNEFGVTRYSKYRTLASLSEAGLISVQSTNEKNPVVMVTEISGGQI